jgi:hypothetical protein
MSTYTASFENGDSNRRYQEKYTLIQQPERKKMISKKGRPDTYGQTKSTR